MSQVMSKSRNGPPAQLDMRKLPPGHAMFSSSKDKKGVIICHGHPYDLGGKLLQADTSWLRDNGFRSDDDVVRLLAMSQHNNPQTAPQKQCTQCGASMAMSNKFCSECGTPQVVWTPGSDDEGDRLAKLVDPEDPLSSLDTILNPRPDPRKETPEEIYQRLSARENEKFAKDLTSGGTVPQGLDIASSKLENNQFGTIVVDNSAPAGKKKK